MPVLASKPRRIVQGAVPSSLARTLDKQRLLGTRICDLVLKPEGALADCLDQLRDELMEHDIGFVPLFYLGEDDFWTAIGGISINIPWYLATPALWKLVNTRLCAYTRREVMMYLRHEVGHAVGYAFGLWKRKDMRRVFGNFDLPYEDAYDPNPWSREHVRYLHETGMYHYAQKHPDEDWAETFATWLDPSSRWRRKYKGWPGARKKLEFVDTLLGEEQAACGKPPNTREALRVPYTDLKETVAEYLKLRDAVDPVLADYRKDLHEIFGASRLRAAERSTAPTQPAARFIAQHHELLERRLVQWLVKVQRLNRATPTLRRTVRRLLRQLQIIAAHENLGVQASRRREVLVDLTLATTRHALSALSAPTTLAGI